MDRVKLARLLVSLLMVLAVVLHISGSHRIELLDRFSNILYDIRLKATLPGGSDPRLVIVDIDEKSLAAEGRWPWHRDKLSFLLDMLFDYYDVQLAAFDVAFPEPDDQTDSKLLRALRDDQFADHPALQQKLAELESEFDYDTNFAASIAGRNVVLGYFIGSTEDVSTGLLPAPLMTTDNLPFTDDLFLGRSYGANLELLQMAAYNGGFFNNPFVDEDGVYRRYPVIARLGDYVFSSLPLAIIHALLQNADLQFQLGEGYSGRRKLEALHVDSFSIPVDANGAIKIPYRGPYRTFEYVSVTDILNGEADPTLLEGRIAIIGTTAAGLYDLRATPVQNIFPGVEIHANIVSGILDQNLKQRPAFLVAAELIEALLMAIVVMLILPRLAAGWMTVGLFILVGLVVGVDYYAWQQGLDIRSAAVLVLIFWLYMVQMFFGYFFETRRKHQLSRVFGQYIPPELVDEIARKDIHVKLSGESREMTVLFSDVRGFTTISESLDSQELTQLINEILTPITQVIYTHRGTIDKYMGDAVMAFWGAPIRMPDHAEQALRAAMQIIQAINALQAQFAERGLPPIRMGVGLNSGRMSVGNMGSEFRMAYTVMGDAVNLGSRLEGLTKAYGVDIIIGESTRKAVPHFACRELDRVRVKGKNEPITIYEPVAERGALSQAQQAELDALEQALGDYRKQAWRSAAEQFQTLHSQYPERTLYTLYLKRIAHYQTTPPPADWDGVYTHTSK